MWGEGASSMTCNRHNSFPMPLLSKTTRLVFLLVYNGISERISDLGYDQAIAGVRVFTLPGGRQAAGWRRAEFATRSVRVTC